MNRHRTVDFYSFDNHDILRIKSFLKIHFAIFKSMQTKESKRALCIFPDVEGERDHRWRKTTPT